MSQRGADTSLIFARTQTTLFFETVWPTASAILFLEGRLYFHLADGSRAGNNSGVPSCLIAYGARDAEIPAACGPDGKYLRRDS